MTREAGKETEEDLVARPRVPDCHMKPARQSHTSFALSNQSSARMLPIRRASHATHCAEPSNPVVPDSNMKPARRSYQSDEPPISSGKITQPVAFLCYVRHHLYAQDSNNIPHMPTKRKETFQRDTDSAMSRNEMKLYVIQASICTLSGTQRHAFNPKTLKVQNGSKEGLATFDRRRATPGS